MAKRIRKPPSPADFQDPRAREYFDADLYDQNRMVGERTYDLPNIGAATAATFTITVSGALPDKGQTIEYGLPANWNTNLIVAGAYVSAVDTVTLVIYNPTGGSINQASGTYSVRVRP
jgi:hypothetical protein